MTSKVEVIVKDAIRQGWRKTPGAKHWKLWEPTGRRYTTVPFNFYSDGNYRAEKNFLSDMRKMGYRPSEEIEAEEKKSMPSVSELIKANGEGRPPEPKAPEPTNVVRVSRTRVGEDILVVLRGSYPSEVDKDTLKMKVAMQNPGLKENTLYIYLAKLKAVGKILNTRMGYYRAASADVTWDEAPLRSAPAPLEPLVPVLPVEAKQVIEGLLTAVAAAEKLLVRLSREVAEHNEAKEAIKRMAAKL